MHRVLEKRPFQKEVIKNLKLEGKLGLKKILKRSEKVENVFLRIFKRNEKNN